MRKGNLLNSLRKASSGASGMSYIAEGIRHLAVPLKSVNVNNKNERLHDARSIAAIKSMLQEFGQRVPIVVQRQGMITRDGNGRVLAAHELGWTHIAALVVDESDARSIAYAIGANRTPELSEWNMEILNEHFMLLQEEDVDLEMLGWSDDDLSDFPLTPIAEGGLQDGAGTQDEDVDTGGVEGIPDEYVTEAWRMWSGEVADQIDALLKAGLASYQGVTKGYALLCFLKARYTGVDYPRHCSFVFHPEQVMTAGDSGSPYDALRKTQTGKIDVARIRFSTADKMRLNFLYSGSLPLAGNRIALDFPAALAKRLINEYAPENGRILDPCHGWGGRFVGFLLSKAKHYTGIDVSPSMHKGVSDAHDLFMPYAEKGKDAKLLCMPFEDWENKGKKYDFALTSPPYFDVEKYQGGKQSHSAYSNYDAWRDGFYTTLIQKVFDALNDDSFFALQVGSQRYPLVEDAKTIAKNVGFEVHSVLASGITNNFMGTDTESGEVIVLLHKPAK